MLAARLTAEGGVVHCPGGGTHHGRPDRAAGFCYLNDPVLGLLTWLDLGLDNIVYLDIDAHHGDGVEDAFAGDKRVLTISIHEEDRWPYTGRAEDRAGGCGAQLPRAARFQRQRDAVADGRGGAAADRAPAARRRFCCNAAPTRWRKTRWQNSRCRTMPIGRWSRRSPRWRPGWS